MYYTKKGIRILCMVILASAFVILLLLIKYKPSYKVIISGEEVGYINNKENFEEKVKTTILETNDKPSNVDSIIYEEPKYEFQFVERNQEENEFKVYETIKNEAEITYKYYDIAINNETVNSVNTIDDAENVINQIKENKDVKELDISIIEKHTLKSEEVNTNNIETAKTIVDEKIEEKLVEEQKAKEEQERINSMPVVNGIRLAVVPVTGNISSRYGESSSIRKSTHTGIDIACSTGTPIQVVANGVVTCASYNGSYGNLVKVDHGNGVETWYAHASKINVSVGNTVSAGDVIAEVGSTGNSTGAHLHLEIRIDGETVNPQNYLYN